MKVLDITNVKNQISNRKTIAVIIAIISFYLLSNISFAESTLSYTALSEEDFTSLYFNENYTTVVVEIPRLLHQPEAWYKKFNNADNHGTPIPIIAERYNGIVYLNDPEYAHSKILVPQENYKKLVRKFESLGFIVRNNSYLTFHLDYSKLSVGFPCFQSYNLLSGKNVKIAIIDSGIDDSHTDFPGTYPTAIDKIIYWMDTTYQSSGSPNDPYGHGTFVASIVAGTGAASNGIYSGVASGAKLMILKACVGMRCEKEDVAEAIDYAVDNGADIISISLGWTPSAGWCDGTTTETDAKAMYEAIDHARSHDIPVVVSAGNSGPEKESIDFPACVNLGNVIAVGSTIKKDYGTRWEKYWDPKDAYVNYYVTIKNEGRLISSGTFGGSRTDWSGFKQIIQPYTWPATIEVKLEGQNRKRDCYSSEEVKWDPGESGQGDSYWTWTKKFSTGPYIVVELFVKPDVNEWTCLDLNGGWHHYYLNDESHVYVNIYRTGSLSTEGHVNYDSARGPLGNVNNDCVIDQTDLDLCSQHYGENWPPCDFNNDGVVDILDINILGLNMGKVCKPFVVAPGVDICAARADGTTVGDLTCGNDKYVSATGTSASAPFVAGLIAVMKELNPSASLSTIKQALIQTDEKLLGFHPDYMEGYGRVSATKSLKSIDSSVVCSSPSSPPSSGGGGGGSPGPCGSACVE